jgi:hypothetical protein
MKLIDKSALVAEIENLENICKKYPTFNSYEEDLKEGRLLGYKDALDVINTLEVKEMDLEKELQSFFYPHVPWGDYCKNEQEDIEEWSFKIAKHFFELGLRSTITEEDCKLIWNIGDDLPYMPEEDFFKELLQRYKTQKGE